MKNERLEEALEWCKKNNIGSTRLKKFNREVRKRHFGKNQDRGRTIARRKNLSNY